MKTTNWRMKKNTISAKNGMVVSEHTAVTKAGVDVLMNGGNAVDAAVAMGFAVGVCGPFMSGLGGGGHMVIYEAQSGQTAVVDYNMRAPKAATPDMYEFLPGPPGGNFSWRPVKDVANAVGYRSVTVPGTIAGLCLALEKFGTMGRAEVTKAAVEYAEDGFDVDEFLALSIASRWGIITQFPETAALFLDSEGSLQSTLKPPGRIVQKDLAQTLKNVVAEGADAYYSGATAHAIAQDMRDHGGLLSEEDLASYKAEIFRPGLTTSYHGYTVVAPPESCGGPTMVEALNILDSFELQTLPHNSGEALHLIAEALRLAFADRFRMIGDPDFVPSSLDELTSKSYARELAKEVDLEQAKSLPPITELLSTEVQPAKAPASVSGGAETTQLCVADKEGNVVSITQTLQTWSGVIPGGSGVPLNGAMSWFNPEPGRANSVEGGKRILSNMCPVIVLKDGKPVLAFGAPGGRKIMSAVLQVLVNVVDYGMDLQRAIAAPRIDACDTELLVDDRIPRKSIDELKKRGHRLVTTEEVFLGRRFAGPAGIQVDPTNGELHSGLCEFDLTCAAGY